MNIALIAHDKKKDDMIRFATAYKAYFGTAYLFATGTTGQRIMEATVCLSIVFIRSSWRRSRDRCHDCQQ